MSVDFQEEYILLQNTFYYKECDEFICPITQTLIEKCVETSDGNKYEYEAIKKWFKDHNTSPLTNLELENKNLKLIQRYEKIFSCNNCNLSMEIPINTCNYCQYEIQYRNYMSSLSVNDKIFKSIEKIVNKCFKPSELYNMLFENKYILSIEQARKLIKKTNDLGKNNYLWYHAIYSRVVERWKLDVKVDNIGACYYQTKIETNEIENKLIINYNELLKIKMERKIQ